jgi:site-specific recombinase XerD
MPMAKPIKRTFNELAFRYVANHAASLSNHHMSRRIEQLSHHIVGFFGSLDLTQITPVRVEKFIYHLESQGLKPAAIENCLVTFRACMKFALRQKWTDSEQLSKPLLLTVPLAAPTGPQLSADEFNLLYQDLMHEMSKDVFH